MQTLWEVGGDHDVNPVLEFVGEFTTSGGWVEEATAGRMKTGVYRKIEGRTGVGLFYQFLLLMREHTTGEEAVAYIPLRVEPEWAGTVRPCYMPRSAFERKFEYVGEGLPCPITKKKM